MAAEPQVDPIAYIYNGTHISNTNVTLGNLATLYTAYYSGNFSGNFKASGTLTGSQINAGANKDGYVYCRYLSGESQSSSNPMYHGISMGYPGKDTLDFHEYGGVFRFYRNQGGAAKVCEINNGGITFPENGNKHGLLSTNVGYFDAIGTSYIEINISGAGAYGISIWASDKRLKDNIEPSTLKALDVVNAIEHKQFIYKNDENRELIKIGYLADQLKELDPQLIFEVGPNKMKQPNEKYIIPLLSKAIQELSQENNELKDRLERLEKIVYGS